VLRCSLETEDLYCREFGIGEGGDKAESLGQQGQGSRGGVFVKQRKGDSMADQFQIDRSEVERRGETNLVGKLGDGVGGGVAEVLKVDPASVTRPVSYNFSFLKKGRKSRRGQKKARGRLTSWR
jgi:hypothetical protein